jgi:hypothetical protein
MLQVDDVNLVPVTEDIGGHLRAPVAGLVTEVSAGLQHLSHGDVSHL